MKPSHSAINPAFCNALGVSVGAGSVKSKTAVRETNDFYFNYYHDVPQIFNVNCDSG